MGHLGVDKVYELIRRSYWFPDMKNKINDFILNCLKCITYQPKQGKKEGYLHIFDKFDEPFNTIHIDHVGPFEITKQKNQYILVVVDGFTKFVKFYATRTSKTCEVIKHLRNFCQNYSVPQRIISDRGSCFTSKLFKSFVVELGVQHVLNATNSPQSNGQTERMNRTLVPMLAKLVDFNNGKFWDVVLADVEYNFNNTINRSIGTTPSIALFGLNQTRNNDFLVQAIEIKEKEDRDLEQIRKEIEIVTDKNQLINKAQFDKRRKESEKYNNGDFVMIRNNVTETGVNHKLIPKYKGPYIVKETLPNDRYVITDIPGQRLSNKSFNGVFAPFNMKHFIEC